MGYGSDLKGISGGLDWIWEFPDESYLRMGMVIGYVRGDTNFSWPASGKCSNMDSDICSGGLFAASEYFGENNLKTNISRFAGFGHGKNKLARIDADGNSFKGQMSSNNQFVHLEIVKNLCTAGGVQIGPWLRTEYNHVAQKEYTESGAAGSRTISRIGHNSIDVTIGVNMEREFQHETEADSRLRIFLKAGWCRQALRKHSSAAVHFDVPLLRNIYSPKFGYSRRNSALLIAGFREKFDVHWDLTASWHGFFSKNYHGNILSATIAYNF
jgi:outer membrane autotransporter protein